jgi:putative ABC transport system ATP-binding protein
MEPLITAKDLSVIYNPGRSNEVRALDGANIEIYPKEYVILFGPSGCGKSTLLYTILGLRKPSKGNLFVEGKEISQFSEKELVEYRRNKIGMIFQAYYLIPSLNVFQNIILPRFFVNEKITERNLRAEMLLKKLSIANQRKKLPSILSGGEQQRVAIARALINNSQILLADEPVGNLDSQASEIVMNTLKDINEKDGKTVILVTHDSRFLHFAHRVYYMEDGKIIRESIDLEKKQFKEVRERDRFLGELHRMAQHYPDAEVKELKAKVLADYLTREISEFQKEILEKGIQDVLEKKITFEELYEILDKPIEEGGAGFYKQTARKFVSQIKELLKASAILKSELQERMPITKEIELTRKLRRLLLDEYSGQISYIQAERIEEGINRRIAGDWDKKVFEQYLDRPIKESGVGLNRATAKKLAQKLEIILVES